MSRRTTSALRRALDRRRAGDAGFSLVEVLVAFTLFGIAAASTIPLLLSGAKAGQSAKLSTQAKNLAQERVDRMRNLPFHVDAKNGPYRDLLDTYYRNLVPAGGSTLASATTGYVADTSTARVPGEPTVGAYYRYVVPADPSPAAAGFRQIVATQFLNSRRLPVTPPAASPYTYDSQSLTGNDVPPSQLVGVTVITSWTRLGQTKTFKLFSEIADAKPAAALIASQARASALRVSSTVDGSQLAAEAGVVNADGALATGSTASVIGQGAVLSLNPGTTVKGAEVVMASPPDASVGTVSSGPRYLNAGTDCTLACVGKTSVRNNAVSVTNGLPVVGAPAAPVTASVIRETVGYRFSNRPNNPNLLLAAGRPVVSAFSFVGDPLVNGSAYLAATAGAGHDVRALAAADTEVIRLFETTFTPLGRGVLEIELVKSSLSCSAAAGTSSSLADFSAFVRYYDWANARYVTLPEIRPGAGNVLASYNPATIQVGPGRMLSDYIAGWDSLSAATTTTDPQTRAVSASLDGIVQLTTVATRDLDPTSAIAVRVGSLSCYAEDNRP